MSGRLDLEQTLCQVGIVDALTFPAFVPPTLLYPFYYSNGPSNYSSPRSTTTSVRKRNLLAQQILQVA